MSRNLDMSMQRTFFHDLSCKNVSVCLVKNFYVQKLLFYVQKPATTKNVFNKRYHNAVNFFLV